MFVKIGGNTKDSRPVLRTSFLFSGGKNGFV